MNKIFKRSLSKRVRTKSKENKKSLSLVFDCFFIQSALSRTGSMLAHTHLSPFARCILGLSRHFYIKYIMRSLLA